MFTTSDGVKIMGDWYPAEGERFALLLHMMPATKESWIHFAEKLGDEGISCLAIDERGHGESTKMSDGTGIDYKQFTDEQQQAKQLDVEAALEWLADNGMTERRLVVVGASIGANLMITALATHKDIPMGIALSPGLDFHGVMTSDSITFLERNQNVLLCASEDDPESFGSVNDLHALNTDCTHRIVLENAGHGTDIFKNDPEFMGQLVTWVTKKL